MSTAPTAWCRRLGNYGPALPARPDAHRVAGLLHAVSRDKIMAFKTPRAPNPNIEWLERRRELLRKSYTFPQIADVDRPVAAAGPAAEPAYEANEPGAGQA